MPARLTVSAFVLGFTSLLLQVVVARELLTSFLGNEISIALILLAWLALVALGSALGGRWARRHTAPLRLAAWLHDVLVIAPVVAVAVAAAAGGVGRFPGQVIGPGVMLLLSAATLGLPCLALGALFAVLCKAAEAATGQDRSAAVYSWEALGAVGAGLLFHFAIAGRLHFTQAALVAGAANLLAWLIIALDWRRARARSVAILAPVALILLALLLIPMGPLLSLHRWRGATVVADVDSRYGNIAVVTESGQMTFYESGLPAFTTEDTQANEVAIHPALLAHPNPRRVLMISGGLGGGLTEALKHPIERLDYVEMDGRLVELAQEHLPDRLKQALHDPRVRLHLQDGRQYVRRCTEHYDVILVLVPDPATTVLSRYYTREFYQEVRRLLARGGLLCTGLSAAQARLSGPRLDLHASVYHALQSVFPAVDVIPGERTQYLAAEKRETLCLDPLVLARRLQERRIHTAFMNETWLRFGAGPLPRDMLLGSLSAAQAAAPNRDTRPVAAHYWLRTWLAQLSPKMVGVLVAAGRAVPALWLLIPLSLGVSLVLRRRPGLPAATAGICIWGTGFLEMGAQLALVMAYQAVVGYLYHRIGLLMSLFMLGLAAGAAAGRRLAARWPGRLRPMLALVVVAQAASALCVPMLFAAGGARQPVVDGVFALAAAWLGCLGGLNFPLAVALLAGREGDAARAASRLYALDLCGAATGAVLIGAVAIPAVGIGQTSHVLAAVMLAALTPLVVAAWGRGRSG
jgi:spermidine synthase